MNRYFIVMYVGTGSDGKDNHGIINLDSTNYVCQEAIREYLDTKKNERIRNAIITNIIEVSKKDYESFENKTYTINDHTLKQ